jgi:hypothetical protein
MAKSSFVVDAPKTSSRRLLDNGASHHVIPHLSNISLHKPYTEPYDIIIGGGSLTHTIQPLSKLPLYLKMFCVPSM